MNSLRQLKIAVPKLTKRLDEVTVAATLNTTCLRKGVGCALVKIRGKHFEQPSVRRVFDCFNGPTIHHLVGSTCTNERGNCGCTHAEQKAMLFAAGCGANNLVMLCTYAPCTNCANLIIAGGNLVTCVIYEHETLHDQRGLSHLRVCKKNPISLAELNAFMTNPEQHRNNLAEIERQLLDY